MRSGLRTPDSDIGSIPHERLEREDEISRYYKLLDVVLGKGSFGTVIEAINVSDSNDHVAVKKVDKAKVSSLKKSARGSTKGARVPKNEK